MRPLQLAGAISTQYEGAATVMMEIPHPRMKRPAISWPLTLAEEMMAIPVTMTQPPTNIPMRRPNRSARGPAEKAPTMEPMV